MTEYLVFQLYGPLSTWGDIAVGEVRPGVIRPSKSAVLGLVAASLGLRRDQEDEQRKLADGYGFAVRVDQSGTPMTDYHTIQVPPSSEVKKRGMHTRKDELGADVLETILSSRDYRMDAVSTVVLWARQEAPYPLEQLARALAEPCFVPYLGRKSCPLALPVQAQVIQAESIRLALEKTSFSSGEWIGTFSGAERKALYWDKDGNAGLDPQHDFTARDAVISRKRWQFDVRHEYHATLE
jgi:CRISPR system Cascade subunit CasD